MPAPRSEPSVELVVTAPGPFGASLVSRVGARTTLGVLTELLASARRHVVIAAPFIQGAEALLSGPLGMALIAALNRGVRVDVVSTGASLAGLELGGLRKFGDSRLRTFQPRGNVEDPRSLGSHAKFLLSDEDRAYVGSANITQRGISGHLEIGVLLHGRHARQVGALVESGHLIEGEH